MTVRLERVREMLKRTLGEIIRRDFPPGGDNGLITRALRSTHIAAIDAGAAEFLQGVLDRRPLGLALEAALDTDPGFELEAALGPWIQGRVFVSWSLA